MSRFVAMQILGAAMLLVLLAEVRGNVLQHRNDFAYGLADEADEGLVFEPLAAGEPDGRPTDHAKVARRIVHKSIYTAFGTNSATVKDMDGYPMLNIISMADSKRSEPSTGEIYFLLTNLDFVGQDILKNNKLTMLFTQDQDLECTKNGIDTMEPTCARIIISGSVVKLDNATAEYKFAMDAYVDRHPATGTWDPEHAFYLCKVHIKSIIALDWYGGPHHVPVEDYFNHKYDNDDVIGAKDDSKPRLNGHRATNDNPRTVRIHFGSHRRDIEIDV